VVREAWENSSLAIICPPHLDTLDFCRFLPEGPIELVGDWGNLVLPPSSAKPHYPELPILGVFTSGTEAGTPRLVLYTRQNITASLNAIVGLFDRRRIEQIFCYAQPFHTFGLLLGYVLSLELGCELLTPDGKYSSAAHQKRLALSNPHLLTLGTPVHFYDLLTAAQNEGRQVSPTYSCIIGGAVVSVELWHKVRDILQIEEPSIGYGCSEASPGISHLPPGRAPHEDGEIGFLLGSLATVVTPDFVSLSGASLCLGVIDDTGVDFATERKIRDALKKREDGVLIYAGRTDLVLNRGGIKVSLEALERSILNTLGIEVICVAIPDQRLGHELGILVKQADRGVFEELQELTMANCHVRLQSELCRFIGDFPRSATAKPDRQAASALFTLRQKETVVR
jgi:acyl-CoA synthetase (AMP-forming)/AMP-acid ligase II